MLPLILPTWLGLGLKGGLFIFLFRQFYLSLPLSLIHISTLVMTLPTIIVYTVMQGRVLSTMAHSGIKA